MAGGIVDFAERCVAISDLQGFEALQAEVIEQENEFRRLFATKRESWEVPEVTDPFVNLVDVYKQPDIFKALPRFAEDTRPRVFELSEKKRKSAGTMTIAPDPRAFEDSWDCFTESQLRYLDWTNIFAAGGSVGACLSPVPKEVSDGSWAEARKKKRAYFHEFAYPGSDVDLFVYGLDAKQAEKKLLEIFEAVQAANPFPVLCFRSAHAISLVSQYPFRHIQVVLRLYNSPAEVLMGFDVDSCAVGYDGKRVLACPRAALAYASQGNSVDMSRRSPSYEMRLAKYAQRGFEVVVPALNRGRVDPFIYTKRFDQVQGLARLLTLEKLQAPEDRFQYRQEDRLQHFWDGRLQCRLDQILGHRQKTVGAANANHNTAGGAELSNYSTVFLPWGPKWKAFNVAKLVKKKDFLLNSIEFSPDGMVRQCTRPYKIHVCFIGTMEQVLKDRFPNDPPIPKEVPKEQLEQCVYGPVAWLVDNPGRQQIGSFHPITEGDWTAGAYLLTDVEDLTTACVADDAEKVTTLLGRLGKEQLTQKDFLGRTALQVAALGRCTAALKVLLPAASAEALQVRLADGRSALHLAAMRGFDDVVEMILARRREVAAEKEVEVADVLDIDGADWHVKLSPLQYAVTFGHVSVVKQLLGEGASARKLAVHKEKEMSLSTLMLCGYFAVTSRNLATAQDILQLLLQSGASVSQVDLSHRTVWHNLVVDARRSDALEMFLKADASGAQTINVLDRYGNTPLMCSVEARNPAATKLLLSYGARDKIAPEEFKEQMERISKLNLSTSGRYCFGGRGNNQTQCSPVLQAAKMCDADLLVAFLEHNPKLVVEERLEVRSGRTRRDKASAAKLWSVLDFVVDQVHKLKLGIEERTAELTRLEEVVEVCKTRVSEKPAGSYTHSIWSAVLSNKQTKLSELKANACLEDDEGCSDLDDEFDDDEKPKNSEEEEIRKWEALTERIRSNGGQCCVEHDPPGSEAQKSKGKLKLPSPLESYNNLPGPSDPQERQRCMEAAQQLFEAAWVGDDAALRSALEVVPAHVQNGLGSTALWLSVRFGHRACVSVTLEAACSQFVPEPAEKDEEGEVDANNIAGQLRRVDNLSLAAGGDGVGESMISPDMWRKRLEAAEQSMLGGTGSSGPKKKAPTNQVTRPPEELLLHRSPVQASEIPQLEPLVSRLETKTPLMEKMGEAGLVPSSVVACFTPLELAVVQGDLEMVELLLQHASAIRPEEPEDEKEENYYQRMYVNTYRGSGRKSRKEFMHQLLRGQNDTAYNLDALQLAVVADSPDIFLVMVKFAKEFSLPLGAVDRWLHNVSGAKTPILEEEDEEEDDEEDEEDEEKDEDEDDEDEVPDDEATSSGEGEEHRKEVDKWMSGELDPTFLQVALWGAANRVAEMLLSGGADDALLEWLQAAAKEEAEAIAAGEGQGGAANKKKKNKQQGHYFGGHKAYRSKSKELVEFLAMNLDKTKELHARLIGVEAEDRRGRSAIFYSRASSVPRLKAAGADLEHSRADGLTPQLAACSEGRRELLCALLDAGGLLAVTVKPSCWNMLHFAVQSSGNFRGRVNLAFGKPSGKDVEKARWLCVQELIETLLSRASVEELEALLMAPGAEHTPLMLAIQARAPEGILKLLADRTAACCNSLVLEGRRGLDRADPMMNTALHWAACLPAEQGALDCSPWPCCNPKAVATLLTAGSNGKAAAQTENAKGQTPLDLAIKVASQVWAEPGQHDDPNVAAGAPSRTRASLGHLQSVADPVEPGQRISLSFEEVKKSAEFATEQVSQGKKGPPELLQALHDEMGEHSRFRDLRRSLYHGGIFPNLKEVEHEKGQEVSG